MVPPRPRGEVDRDVLRFAVVRRLAAVPLFVALVLLAVARPVDLALLGLRAVELFLALLAPLLVERPLLLRADVLAPELLLEDPPSSGHLPDITRCAASLTASAIRAPSLVALDITELAALLAVSAASMPASLIALRALGLALIAAAAAARPAASISLLIAALASLSTVLSFFDEVDFEDFDPVRLVDFAIRKPSFFLTY